jgi:hypothetical protein
MSEWQEGRKGACIAMAFFLGGFIVLDRGVWAGGRRRDGWEATHLIPSHAMIMDGGMEVWWYTRREKRIAF